MVKRSNAVLVFLILLLFPCLAFAINPLPDNFNGLKFGVKMPAGFKITEKAPFDVVYYVNPNETATEYFGFSISNIEYSSCHGKFFEVNFNIVGGNMENVVSFFTEKSGVKSAAAKSSTYSFDNRVYLILVTGKDKNVHVTITSSKYGSCLAP